MLDNIVILTVIGESCMGCLITRSFSQAPYFFSKSDQHYAVLLPI